MITLLVAAILQADTVTIATHKCASCRVTTAVIATIGDSSGPGEVPMDPVIVADALGRYWVGAPFSRSIRVFAPTGTFIRRLGREGSGPGEFQNITLLAESYRGVEVVDDGLGRWSTYGLSLTLTSSRHIGGVSPRSMAVFDGGRAIVGADIRTPDAVGHTMHAVDSGGHVSRSFGAPNLPFLPGGRNLFWRYVVRDGSRDGFWSSHRTEYAFEQCSATTFACTLYVRPVAWFKPHAKDVSPSRETQPVTVFTGVRPDGPQYLWSITLVPDAHWERGMEQVPGTKGDHGLRIVPNKYWDTIIERIDLRARAVVSTIRIDAALLQFIGPSIAYAYRETPSGVPQIDVYRLGFAGQREGSSGLTPVGRD